MTAGEPRVAVIGLGVIGAMATWRLSERGVRVDAYDRFGVPHDRGASGGQTRRFAVQAQREPRLTPLALEAIDLWRELEKHSGRDLLHQTGGVIIGPEGTPALESAAKSAVDNGLPHEVLQGGALKARFPEHLVRAGDIGVTDPMAGFLRPEACIASAVDRAQSLGAEIRTHAKVLTVQSRGDRVAVGTAEGEQEYDRVVLATGPWARELIPAASSVIVPRQPVQAWYVVRNPEAYHPAVFGVFERVGDLTAFGFPSMDGATVKIGVRFGPDNPAVQDPDAPGTVQEAYAARLAEVIGQFFPGLHPYPVLLQPGLEGYSPDGLPLVGLAPDDDRTVIACGFSGAGFKFASVIGDVLAELVLTGRSSRNVSFLAPQRFLEPPATRPSMP